jgi:glycosyltransferase involved in cell wall biosynthesis
MIRVAGLPRLAADGCGESSDERPWPTISLITPVFNSGKYIEQTIDSVLGQDYPNLEYFVVDGGSTDGTVDLIRKYEHQISGWVSEPDKGMYDALNKGFARTTGEIMGWISATDTLYPSGLSVVGSVFRDLPNVEWLTGRPAWLNEEGKTMGTLEIPRWSRGRFLAGANRYIQQESTFWRRSLWEKAGARLDDSRRMANDFELWVRFFRHAKIFPVDAMIGGFRAHGDSLGLQQLEECHRIHDEIVEAELGRAPWGKTLRAFRRVSRAAHRIPKLRGLWNRAVMGSLYRMPGPDWPPVITHQNDRWKFRR